MNIILVAYDKNRLIGGNNSLLWQGQMAADMRRFRKLTSGNVVIMGRKTYDSIGCPLPNRQNIVVSRQALKIDGAKVVDSLEKAYTVAEPGKDIYIIGGGQIYAQSISGADKILATEIDAELVGDTYFPALTNDWHVESRDIHAADDKNKYDYSFVVYSRS
jgi:dihydrofolate reductase